jgi:hypothetical protein
MTVKQQVQTSNQKPLMENVATLLDGRTLIKTHKRRIQKLRNSSLKKNSPSFQQFLTTIQKEENKFQHKI